MDEFEYLVRRKILKPLDLEDILNKRISEGWVLDQYSETINYEFKLEYTCIFKRKKSV